MSSLAQPPTQDRRISPTLELATNNPFRARLSSAPLSPDFPPSTTTRERPQSRNPFLDVFDEDQKKADFNFETGSSKPYQKSNSFDTSTQRPALNGSAAELFENLTLNNQPSVDSRPKMNRPPSSSKSRPSAPSHHKSRSGLDEPTPLISVSSFGEDNLRLSTSSGRRHAQASSKSSGGDRPRDSRRRPRRNSDSSVIEVHESETRERSQRDRGNRDRKTKGDSSSKSRREGSSDRRKKHSALDVIDKLDVTGIYGSGLFHHDGPFDACNPHRNKSSRRLAPVQAFPADSENNSMTGFGPVNLKADHSHIFGDRDAEAFGDYATGKRPVANRAAAFDPKATVETVHGDETLGLGTSTFLDGTPASRAAIEKNASESQEDRQRSSSDAGLSGSGLQRKKSLAQKFRSIKAGGPDVPISSRRRAPLPPGGNRSPPVTDSPTTPSFEKDTNYYAEGDDTSDKNEKKGEVLNVVDRERMGLPGSPRRSQPRLPGNGGDDNANGLLKRVRSLSKPKQRRPEL